MNPNVLIPIAAVVVAIVLFLVVRRTQSAGPARAPGRARIPEEGQGTDADVRRLLDAGKKIAAIKVYREIHGVGLREAKEAVERLD